MSLDYDSIVAKKEGYGPIGKGGNGLILHSALAIDPEIGQSLGMLWQNALVFLPLASRGIS